MRFGKIVLCCTFALALQGCAASHTEGATSVATETPPAATPTPEDVGPYPIVLMHGMAGWTSIAGYEYFNGIPEALRGDGWTVYTTSVDPFQSVEVRAAQAATRIDQILAETGAHRVILIGHSQGGLDARYIVSSLGYGDRVKSVTTLATPHHGSKISEISLGLFPGDSAAATAALASALLGTVTGTSADIGTQIHELTSTYCEQTFNPANPDDARVEYFSASGISQPWITVDPTVTDIVNPLLLASWWIVDATEGDNDGLVAVNSAKWGTFLGTVPADHGDEVGQPPLTLHPAFDQVSYFRALAAFLEGAGPAP